MSKKTIVAQDANHLCGLIAREIELNGNECDLNHIDVSQIKDMSLIFYHSKFNGNISQWNVSSVEDMNDMFKESVFNGDISKWDVSNVKSMQEMFKLSKFNGDISQWNVSSVKNMIDMFCYSKFNGDISNWDVSKVKMMNFMFEGASFFKGDLSRWKPYSLQSCDRMFVDCPEPYWYFYENQEKRNEAIDFFQSKLKLHNDLEENLIDSKFTLKIKI